MISVKVQQRSVKAKGKTYSQYWITLPKALCESMRIDKGDTRDCYIERWDIILRRV
jgi:hypothetical protein